MNKSEDYTPSDTKRQWLRLRNYCWGKQLKLTIGLRKDLFPLPFRQISKHKLTISSPDESGDWFSQSFKDPSNLLIVFGLTNGDDGGETTPFVEWRLREFATQDLQAEVIGAGLSMFFDPREDVTFVTVDDQCVAEEI